MSGPDASSVAGDAYEAYIAEQLAEERAAKTSIEARGLSVITTSGALVTLLFAVSALVTSQTGYHPPRQALALMAAALVLLLGAAGLGLYSNWPRGYHEAKVSDLQSLVDADEKWNRSASDGKRTVAESRLVTLKRARAFNNSKGKAVQAAISLEVGGIGLVAVGVIQVLAA